MWRNPSRNGGDWSGITENQYHGFFFFFGGGGGGGLDQIFPNQVKVHFTESFVNFFQVTVFICL